MKKTFFFVPILSLISIFLFLGCESGTGGGETDDGSPGFDITLNDVFRAIDPGEEDVPLNDEITLKLNTPISLSVSTTDIPAICQEKKGDSKTGLIKVDGTFSELGTADIGLTLDEGFNDGDSLAYIDETTGDWIPVASYIDTATNTIRTKITHFSVWGVITKDTETPEKRVNRITFTDKSDPGNWEYSFFAMEYDENNDLEEITFQDKIYTFTFVGDKLTKMLYADSGDFGYEYELHVYEYSGDNIINCTMYESDVDSNVGVISEYVDFSYDEDGNLIEKKHYESPAKIDHQQTITYIYDSGLCERSESVDIDSGESEITDYEWSSLEKEVTKIITVDIIGGEEVPDEHAEGIAYDYDLNEPKKIEVDKLIIFLMM